MIFVYGPTFLKILGEGWGQITFPNSTNRDNAYKATTDIKAAVNQMDLEEFKCKPIQSA